MYIVNKGLNLDLEKTLLERDLIHISKGSIKNTANNNLIVINKSTAKINVGINKIYYDLTYNKIISTTDKSDKPNLFVQIYEIDVDSDFNILGSIKIDGNNNKVITYQESVDSVVDKKIEEALEGIYDLKADYMSVLVTENVVIQDGNITVLEEIESLASIYIEDMGNVDINDINISNRSILLEEESLNDLNATVSYNVLKIKE